jgi:uncharacterized protein (DUF2062 family)
MIRALPLATRSCSFHLRKRFTALRTEGAGAARETAAIALGVFVGCLPIYGLHLLVCWIAGAALRLNRLKMYLAANISNPFVAPWLLFAEIQAGAWIRRGAFHPLSRQAIAATPLSVFGFDLVYGSVAVALLLALAAAAGTYSLVRRAARNGPFGELVRRAADRYVASGITAWEFARGKLAMDPVYRAAVAGALLPDGGTLVDIGCGQGLTLALLAEARTAYEEGAWPAGWPPPPRFDRMVGIEARPRVASMARTALEPDAEVLQADARTVAIGRARAILLFDVLHLLPVEDQDALLGAVARQLDPGGVVLVREADAGAGWRFRAVRIGNRLKAFLFGTWRRQTFNPRTPDEWRTCFERHGFDADVRPMGEGTPFANVLFRLIARDAAARPTRSALPA